MLTLDFDPTRLKDGKVSLYYYDNLGYRLVLHPTKQEMLVPHMGFEISIDRHEVTSGRDSWIGYFEGHRYISFNWEGKSYYIRLFDPLAPKPLDRWTNTIIEFYPEDDDYQDDVFELMEK